MPSRGPQPGEKALGAGDAARMKLGIAARQVDRVGLRIGRLVRKR